MSKTVINVDDIVQLSPETTGNKAFGGCLMVVTGVYEWGVQGYVNALNGTRDKVGGVGFYRAEHGTFVPTGGKAHWLHCTSEDEGEPST